MNAALEIRRLCPELAAPLARLFECFSAAGIDKHFHPHPFTSEDATRITQYVGNDLFYALMLGDRMLGYGLLRGWDEGYEIPSLGVAVDPAAHGQGYGRLLMEFLHAAARARGAGKIRLKVYSANEEAVSLYRSLGYVFQDEEAGQLVGILENRA